MPFLPGCYFPSFNRCCAKKCGLANLMLVRRTSNCELLSYASGKLQRTSFSCHWCLGDSIIRGCAGSAIFGQRRLFLSMPFIASCFASGSTSDQCLLQGQHKTKFLCCPWLAVPVDFQSRPRPDLARQH